MIINENSNWRKGAYDLNVILNIRDYILLWDHASVKMMDVRHTSMFSGDELRSYRFPASGFIYTTVGGAVLRMDGIEQRVNGFYVLHGGKGACLEVYGIEDTLEYYLIFYKATIPLPSNQKILRLIDQYDPFRLQYGFAPLYPVSLYQIADLMLQQWQRADRLERFHVKTLFYQFVYELMPQLKDRDIDIVKPNLVEQIIRYMHDNYNKPITRESVAQLYHYSVPYLSKRFRKETGSSMIDYLIGIRIEKAKKLLQKTDITIQQTATSVGYDDVSYFTRIFKKVTGVSPKQFKDRSREDKVGLNRPIAWLRSSIVSNDYRKHNSNENDYHYEGEESLFMYRNRASMGVTLILCLTLLLSACSGASNTNSPSNHTNNGSSSLAGQTEAVNGSTTSNAETIVYKAINGDIQIPKNPHRIVVVAGAYVGYLLALGIEPVGVGGEAFDNEYIKDKLDGVENIGEEVSLEKIVELQPDLIIIWNNPDDIASLSKIAPTVAIEYGTPVREQLEEFGKMTSRESQATAWIDAWDQKIANYKPQVEAAVGEKTVSIFDAESAKEIYAYGSFGRGGDILYGEFNLKAPPIIQKEAIDSGSGWAKLSLELMPEYAGDYIFISGWAGRDNPGSSFSGSIWNNLPAVKNNKVYTNNERGFVYSDPLSLEAQLKFVVDSIVKN